MKSVCRIDPEGKSACQAKWYERTAFPVSSESIRWDEDVEGVKKDWINKAEHNQSLFCLNDDLLRTSMNLANGRRIRMIVDGRLLA